MSEFIEFISPEALAKLKEAQGLVDKLAQSIKDSNNFKPSTTPSGADKNIQSLNEAYQKQDKIIQGLQSQLLKLSNVKTQYNAQNVRRNCKSTQTSSKC